MNRYSKMCVTLSALAGLAATALAQDCGDSAGYVRWEQKISDTEGGFGGNLDDGDAFGYRMCAIGDVDGDGVVDAAVSAWQDEDGGRDRGAVWILFLRPDGTVKMEQKISELEGGFGGDLDDDGFFGSDVVPMGDLDGNGVPDLAIGNRNDNDGGNKRGAVWIVLLNSDGTVRAEQKISDLEGGFGGNLDNRDRFGTSLASIGDLDGNGVPDLAVGAASDDDGGDPESNRGAVWILFMDCNDQGDCMVIDEQKISDIAGAFGGNLEDGDHFGYGLAPLGDFDGDSYPDLAVGAPFDDDGQTDSGAVWILLLNENGTVKREQKISDVEGGFGGDLGADDWFGHGLARIEDLDGDGVDELAVGAIQDDDAAFDAGAVWLLFLDPASLRVTDERKITSAQSGFGGGLDDSDLFGTGIASLGDLDGNGVTDMIAGATWDADGGADRGAVWFMSLDGCPTRPVIIADPVGVVLDAPGQAQFTVVASGRDSLHYQWRRDGVALTDGDNIFGATTATLRVDASDSDIGLYDVLVSTEDGEAASRPAALAIRNDCPVDFNRDGSVNTIDLIAYLNEWTLGCP